MDFGQGTFLTGTKAMTMVIFLSQVTWCYENDICPCNTSREEMSDTSGASKDPGCDVCCSKSRCRLSEERKNR